MTQPHSIDWFINSNVEKAHSGFREKDEVRIEKPSGKNARIVYPKNESKGTSELYDLKEPKEYQTYKSSYRPSP